MEPAKSLPVLPDQLIDVPAGSYVPGKVLNHGMRISDSEFVVFLNSDCVPTHPGMAGKAARGFFNCATGPLRCGIRASSSKARLY
jgi:hypothetical protein